MTKDFHTFSDYLGNIKRKHTQALEALVADDKEALKDLIVRVGQLDVGTPIDESLRELKSLFSYRWAHARLSRSVDSDELGCLQTAFAEATINRALIAAWSEDSFLKIVPENKRAEDGSVPGLFVLGLGKLGGYDLNFSSDVDLIAFYDPEILPVPEMHGRMDVCVRVLKRMTQLLSKSIASEFVWRVDWRLRPDASVNPIVMSSSAALDFYFFRSLPWHRLAMIKARVVAGDMSCGANFLSELSPYIWRQNLDYTAVDDVRNLKQKINQEHPQLKLARAAEAQASQKGSGQKEAAKKEGFNLKLGKGGIREIEFIVNAMQLLWGGKKPQLRNYRTLDVLDALTKTGLFEEELTETLARNYRQLRLIEDALQIRENLQTHSLPKSEKALSELHQMLASDKKNEAGQHPLEMVETCSTEVSEEFERFFAILSPGLPAVQRHVANTQAINLEALDWYQTLPKAEQSIVNDWSEGFSLYAVPPRNAEKLTSLFSRLIDLISSEKGDTASLVNKLHTFFRSTPKGGQYLRLLCAQPHILKDVLEPIASSPAMTILLEQSPHIVDYMLEPSADLEIELETGSKPEFDSEFVLVSEDFDIRLKRLRTFVNEQLYDTMLRFFKGQLSSLEIQGRLTALAEHCLNLGLRITAEDMAFSELPIAVLGMGKLGMKAMAPLSDLDLIFIAKEGIELEQANRFSNRFRHLMEVKTSEGRAYEMDTRLRPSGRSGPVTVTVEGFERYHLNAARSWEHIALVPARAVSGPVTLLRQVEAVRAQILSKSRSRKQFLLDATKMHARVRDQRIDREEDNAINVKLRRGGMFETDYLSACLVLLSGEPEQSFALEYDGLVNKVLNDAGSAELIESISFWRSLQIWSRILGLENGPLEMINSKRLDVMLEDLSLESPDALMTQVERHSDLVGSVLETVLAEAEGYMPDGGLGEWGETAVEWE